MAGIFRRRRRRFSSAIRLAAGRANRKRFPACGKSKSLMTSISSKTVDAFWEVQPLGSGLVISLNRRKRSHRMGSRLLLDDADFSAPLEPRPLRLRGIFDPVETQFLEEIILRN